MTARAISPFNPKATANRGRVLILSANPVDCKIVQTLVEAAGAQVAGICGRQQDAIQAVRELQPDLVLAAIFFEGEPVGIELSRRIQEDHGVPVVYLGQADDPLLLLQIAMTQPAGLVSDPASDPKYLQAVINRALKGVRPAGSPSPY